MTAVVIPFPKEKRPTPNDSAEQVYQDIIRAHKERAEIIVDEVIGSAYNIIHAYNVPLDNENELSLKNTALVVESLRSLLLGISGIPHPLQAIADSIFDVMQGKPGEPPIITIIDDTEEEDEEANVAP